MQPVAETAALLHDDELPSQFNEVTDEVAKLIHAALAQIVCWPQAKGSKDVATSLVTVDAHMHQRPLLTSPRGFSQGCLELLGEDGRRVRRGSSGCIRTHG